MIFRNNQHARKTVASKQVENCSKRIMTHSHLRLAPRATPESIDDAVATGNVRTHERGNVSHSRLLEFEGNVNESASAICHPADQLLDQAHASCRLDMLKDNVAEYQTIVGCGCGERIVGQMVAHVGHGDRVPQHRRRYIKSIDPFEALRQRLCQPSDSAAVVERRRMVDRPERGLELVQHGFDEMITGREELIPVIVNRRQSIAFARQDTEKWLGRAPPFPVTIGPVHRRTYRGVAGQRKPEGDAKIAPSAA